MKKIKNGSNLTPEEGGAIKRLLDVIIDFIVFLTDKKKKK